MHGVKKTAPEVRSGAPDVSLIDAMLALTPEQRLRQNDRMLRTIQELSDGFAAMQADVKVLGLQILAELKRGSSSNTDKLTLLILEETLHRRPDTR